MALVLDCSSCGLQFEREPYAARLPEAIAEAADCAAAFALGAWLLPRVHPHELGVVVSVGLVALLLLPSCLGVAVAWHYRQRARENNVTDPIPPVPRWAGVTAPIFVATVRGLRAFASLHEAEQHLTPRDLSPGGLTLAYDAKGVWFDVYRELERTLGPWGAREHDSEARCSVCLKAFPEQPPRPEALRALLVDFLGRSSGTTATSAHDIGLSLTTLVERAWSRLQPARQQHEAGPHQVGVG